MTIAALKKEMRKSMAVTLKAISEESIRVESASLLKKILASEWFEKAKRVSVYVHTEGEIQTDDIILESLKRNKEGAVNMEILRLKNEEAVRNLKPTLWNIRQFGLDEVVESYHESGTVIDVVKFPPGPLDLVLLPGVAFTKTGERLGHGKGFYDRFLHQHKERFGRVPYLVGLALKAQVVETVPTTPWDVLLNEVLYAD